MKAQQHLIPTVFALACAAMSLAGCSSSSSGGGTNTDSGAAVDASKTDSGSAADTGSATDSGSTTETGGDTSSGTTCPTPLPSGWTCPAAPTLPASSTSCTATDVQGYETICFSSTADTTKCQAYKSATTACDTCLRAWTRSDGWVQTGACYLAIDSTATNCAAADECDNSCTDLTCWNDCTDQTSLQSCLGSVQASGGACDVSGTETTLQTCQGNAKFKACVLGSDADIVNFFQGACQKGGVFTAPAGDAGTDATSDTGSDAATDAATDAADAADAATSG